jgi:hypothetical protein
MALPILLFALLAGQADQPITTQTPAAQVAAPVDPDYLPKGAPSDDYGFVAWCDGVLSGHMDLANHLSDVLPLDDVQQNVGHAYLRAYGKALAVAPENKTPEGRKRAEAARLAGWSNWEDARNTPDKNLAVNTYLAYQLPGRCEHAAQRLAHDPNLFRLSPSVDEVAAMGTGPMATHAQPNMVAPAPARQMTAAPVPVNNGPISASVAADGPGSAPMTQHADFSPAMPTPVSAGPMKVSGDAPVSTMASAGEVKATAAETKKKPAKAKPVKTAAAPTTADTAKPKRGHLLPWFLRGKKSADDPD